MDDIEEEVRKGLSFWNETDFKIGYIFLFLPDWERSDLIDLQRTSELCIKLNNLNNENAKRT